MPALPSVFRPSRSPATDRGHGPRSAALIALLLAGCVTNRPGPQPGESVPCPDGKQRVVARCSSVGDLKQRVLEGNAGLPKLGLGLSARFEELTLAQITSSTQQLAVELDAQCNKYNACVIDADRWLAEEQRLREHVRLIEALRAGPSPDHANALWENAAPALAAARLQLDLRVEARSPGGTFAPHESGAPLHSGDELRFLVQSSVATHVYILMLSSQGTPEKLFPSVEMYALNPIPAGTPVSIPPASIGVFTLDERVGREHVQVIASDKPLPDIEARLASLASKAPEPAREEVLRTVGDLVCEPSGTRGMTLKQTSVSCGESATRGIVLKQTAPQVAGKAFDLSLKAEPNDHVVVLQHEIDHRP